MLIPGIANFVGDFKITTPKIVIEIAAENLAKNDTLEAS